MNFHQIPLLDHLIPFNPIPDHKILYHPIPDYRVYITRLTICLLVSDSEITEN